jgi:hypothetical protein
MISHFIITSAIHTSYGKCSTEERIEQTKETIKSIKTYAPGSSMVIIDCGEKSVNGNLFDCELIDYTKNEEIQYHLGNYLNKNIDLEPDIIIKSMLEIMMFSDYLKNITSPYERIFKISGRYRLNSQFDYSKHKKSNNKILILPSTLSQHFYNSSVGVSMFQYATRLWSFDGILLPKIIKSYQKIKDEIIHASTKIYQCDVEHLLYKHLNKELINTITPIGLEGYWAPLKFWIEE